MKRLFVLPEHFTFVESVNVLVQMKKDNRGDHTITFARKALLYLAKQTGFFY